MIRVPPSEHPSGKHSYDQFAPCKTPLKALQTTIYKAIREPSTPGHICCEKNEPILRELFFGIIRRDFTTPKCLGKTDTVEDLRIKSFCSVTNCKTWLSESFRESDVLWSGGQSKPFQEARCCIALFMRTQDTPLTTCLRNDSITLLFCKRPRGFWGAKKNIKNKTCKQNIHGVVPGFGGEFCLCVFSPPSGMTRKKHITIFCHPPNPGTILQICLCWCVFLFLEFSTGSSWKSPGNNSTEVLVGKSPLLVGAPLGPRKSSCRTFL